jgi:hypothetical protein
LNENSGKAYIYTLARMFQTKNPFRTVPWKSEALFLDLGGSSVLEFEISNFKFEINAVPL